MADREQPYDPYIPSGGAQGGAGAQAGGNQRTAALQAVRTQFVPCCISSARRRPTAVGAAAALAEARRQASSYDQEILRSKYSWYREGPLLGYLVVTYVAAFLTHILMQNFTL
jgi:hypothetical protein